ncbi:MAG: SDR family NAD(P)-dependent oxidoreductase [Deltaproteobacteria bacterium]|nr:SDR family NAD(P)-dependent oxidoreductase [Deltaproteobacteria bacterium]
MGATLSNDHQSDLSPLERRALDAIRELKSRIAEQSRQINEPLAIIGLACRFPGGVTTLPELWQLLLEQKVTAGPIPPGRWGDREEFFSTDKYAPGKTNADRASFLAEPVDAFDAAFFEMTEALASTTDPHQRLLLETAWHALEDAGLPAHQLRGSKTGVFVAIDKPDFVHIAWSEREKITGLTAEGVPGSFVAGRLSFLLDLHGPALIVDTACSSSLVALHIAGHSLRSGESDIAIVGGVNLMLTPGAQIALSKLQGLAPNGRCQPFCANGQGVGRGEGCCAIVLKRLSDAQSAGDRITAVVRGWGIDHDGRSVRITAPSEKSQQNTLIEAFQRASLKPDDVDYIECHGTGTSLGDPIEVRAQAEVFGPREADRRYAIGSIKSNIGHIEAAAGLSGVVKVAQSLDSECIAPQIPPERINPHLGYDETFATIVTSPIPWPRGARPRRAGVSAFGISGTNVHVVLEEAPEPRTPSEQWSGLNLCCLSAMSLESLLAQVDNLLRYLTEYPQRRLEDVCATLASGRSHFTHRLALAVETREQLLTQLETLRITGAREGSYNAAPQHSGRIGLYIGNLDKVADDLPPQLRPANGATAASPLGQVGYLLARWLIHCGLRPAVVSANNSSAIAAYLTAGMLDEDQAAAEPTVDQLRAPAIDVVLPDGTPVARRKAPPANALQQTTTDISAIGQRFASCETLIVIGAEQFDHPQQLHLLAAPEALSVRHVVDLIARCFLAGKIAEPRVSTSGQKVALPGYAFEHQRFSPHLKYSDEAENRWRSTDLAARSVTAEKPREALSPTEREASAVLQRATATKGDVTSISAALAKLDRSNSLVALRAAIDAGLSRLARHPSDRGSATAHSRLPDDIAEKLTRLLRGETSPSDLAQDLAHLAAANERLDALTDLPWAQNAARSAISRWLEGGGINRSALELHAFSTEDRSVLGPLAFHFENIAQAEANAVLALQAQQQRGESGERTRYLNYSLLQEPHTAGLSAGSADLVVAIHTLWLGDPTQQLQRIRSLLTPGALFVGWELNAPALWHALCFGVLSPTVRYLSGLDWREQLLANGFDRIATIASPSAMSTLILARLETPDRQTIYARGVDSTRQTAVARQQQHAPTSIAGLRLPSAVPIFEHHVEPDHDFWRFTPDTSPPVVSWATAAEMLAAAAAPDADDVLLDGLSLDDEPALDAPESATTQCSAFVPADGVPLAELHLGDDGKAWHRVAAARVLTIGEAQGDSSLADELKRCPEQIDPATLDATLRRHGYGALPARCTRLLRGNDELVADLAVDKTDKRYHIDPRLLDAAVLLGISNLAPAPDTRFAPAKARRWGLHGRGVDETTCHVRLTREDVDHPTIDITLYDQQQKPIGGVRDLELVTVDLDRRTNAHGLSEWLKEVSWLSLSAPARDADAPRKWLIIGDGSSLAETLVGEIETRGLSATQLRHEELSRLPLLLNQLRADRASQLGVLFLATTAQKSQLAVDTANIQTLLQLTAQLAATKDQGKARVWLVTRQALSHQGEDVEPHKTLLWGLGRAIDLEQPTHWGGMVDIEQQTAVGSIVDELLSDRQEPQVAYRAGARYGLRLTSPIESPPSRAAQISPEGVYLITGGLGAVGRRLALWLAHQGATELLLCSRQGVQTQQQRDTLNTLETLGVKASVAQFNIASLDETHQALKGVADRIRGVFHLAGSIFNGPLEQITQATVERVLAAKTTGAWNLHRATESSPLDHFVLFGSGSGVWGSNEQTLYAASNAYLEGLANYRAHRKLPALCIAWGTFASETAATQRADLEIGARPMPANISFGLLARQMAQTGRANSVIARIDWPHFASLYSATKFRPLCESLAARHDASGGTAKEAFVAELHALPENERAAYTVRILVSLTAAALGRPEELLDRERSFSELGVDSLIIVSLLRPLIARTGLDIPTSVLYLAESINALGEQLVEMALRADDQPLSDDDAMSIEEAQELLERIDELDEAQVAQVLERLGLE